MTFVLAQWLVTIFAAISLVHVYWALGGQWAAAVVVPQVPVVFASRVFKRHDFSTNRCAICDASLRMPLSRSAFFLGISAAIENHRARTQGRAQASESA